MSPPKYMLGLKNQVNSTLCSFAGFDIICNWVFAAAFKSDSIICIFFSKRFFNEIILSAA